MATVSNVNNQFKFVNTNRTEFYQYPKLSNLTYVLNNDGNYYIQFTYEDDYFVKIKLSDLTNQPTWTNTYAGAEQAIADISLWIKQSAQSIIGTTDSGITVTPSFTRSTSSGSLASACYSLSVSNVGSANGTFLSETIKPGETLNFSAGAINNKYASNTFSWNGAGTELIIIYNA